MSRPPIAPVARRRPVTPWARLTTGVITGAVLAGCSELPRTYDTLGRGGEIIVKDSFDSADLDPAVWRVTGEGVGVVNGRLTLQNTRNHPVWLTTALPDDVDIEFDAWADSPDGDIKVEVAGDGVSFATSASYTATGYVVIFGGWNNRVSVIARQNEHGNDRASRTAPSVQKGRKYHFQIIRRGGTLHWMIDGEDMLTMNDPNPLIGSGQRHFAFNGWQARTQFDNLVIRAMSVPTAN